MDHPIKRPSFDENIKPMFRPGDVSCMHWAVDLTSFESVKTNAQKIADRLSDGSMPPDGPWPPEKIQTFRNWSLNTGFRQYPYVRLEPSAQPRLRKSIHEIQDGSEELDLLKKAFSGLMARDTDRDNPNSYFNLAGIHWLPGPTQQYPANNTDCRHHDNPYNPWHRAFIIAFEDALRTVEGCEEVTLPYWDITGDELPDWMYEEPFFPYKIPFALETLNGQPKTPAGYNIERFDAAKIRQNIIDNQKNIGDQIAAALAAQTWVDFNGWSTNPPVHKAIIQAHDNGHNACGNTMIDQDIAAFDPIFWFFHCNWDRLFWKWQQNVFATSSSELEKLVEGDKSWLEDNALTILTPFDQNAQDTIDLSHWNIDYEHPPETPADQILESAVINARGSVGAESTFSISSLERVSIGIKNLNRLKIPGSFEILLYSGDRLIDKTFIFQPSSPENCDTCKQKGVFHTHFDVNKSELNDQDHLSVKIQVRNQDGDWEEVPMSNAGKPTISVRLLLNSEG